MSRSLIAVLALPLLLVACKQADRAATGKEGRVVPVLTATATRADVPIWLDGLGTVAAWQQVTVRSQVDGRLESVLFKEGQTVKKGDLLGQIDARPFATQLKQAEGALARDKAQLESARLDLERYRTLIKQNLVAQQQVDAQAALVGQIEGAIQIDGSAIDSARLNLDYARIKAPIDGVVGIRLVDAGNLVHASDQGGVVVIAQLDPVAVFVTMPQDDLGRVAAAVQRGEVRVDIFDRDAGKQIATGTLTVIDNQISSSTATIRLKVRVDNPEHKLWPNQFVKARLLVDTQRNALVIPAAAVQRGPQGTFVYVAGADQKAQMKPVELGAVTGDRAILKSGVEPGDQVVLEGQSQLRPGASVAPRQKPGPSPLAPSGSSPSASVHGKSPTETVR